MVNFNDQGGVIPANNAERLRARIADLGTLPPDVAGTNCGNCQFIVAVHAEIGHCNHPKVNQTVTARQCCAFWDTPGFKRA